MKRKHISKILYLSSVLVIVALIGGGCSTGPTPTKASVPNLIYPGFETFPTPRLFDGPGTVFRIDKDRKRHHVKTLDIAIQGPLPEALADAATGSMSLIDIAAYLAITNVPVDLNVKAEFQRNAFQSAKFGKGARYRTEDDPIDKAILAAKIDYKPRNTYWVIREVIATDRIDVSLLDWVAKNASFAATIKRIFTLSPSVDASAFERRELKKTFERPYYVFFIRDQIFPPAPGVIIGPGANPIRTVYRKSGFPTDWDTETK